MSRRAGWSRWVALLALWMCILASPALADDEARSPAPAAPGAEAAPAPAPRSSEAPTIDLYTMGPGDHLFSLFGHAALCVTGGAHPRGICYNYGTTDFSQPVTLVWDFLHGDVKFWVSTDDLRRMIKLYEAFDRTVYRQRLPLSPEAARRAAERLATDALPENRSYFYHHFRDNCSTRLRDHVDVITDGTLTPAASEPYNLSIREMVQHWVPGNYTMLTLSEFVMGRVVDEPTTLWDAMFLPDVLREEVEKRLGVHPEVIYTRKGPLPTGSPRAGEAILGMIALLLGAVTFRAMRRGGWRGRAGLVAVGLLLGGMAIVIDFLVIISDVPELYLNEALLFLLPTDLVLLVGRPPLLRAYAKYRLIGLGIVLALGLVGVLHQPVVAPIAAVAMPMLGILMGYSGPSAPEGDAIPVDDDARVTLPLQGPAAEPA